MPAKGKSTLPTSFSSRVSSSRSMLRFSPPLLAVPARSLPAQLAPAGGCAACNSLFFRHGANASVNSVASVDVVVSACSHSLAWLPAFVEDVKTQSAVAAVNEVVVYAKCGTPPDAPPEARVVALPNVGRCDHTWAHHLSAAYDAVADGAVTKFGGWKGKRFAVV